jgi:rod shape-determining protein MreB
MRLPSLAAGTDLAVDLGTANTVVFRRGEGIVLFEPSVVAMDQQTGQVYAVGEKARQMLGRTPATIVATRPLRHGVIADFETTEQMLGQFIRLVGGSGLRRAVIVCVPSGLTGVERDAVVEATLSAGAREAHLIEEAMAGAIGAELPVEDAVASLVVDVGGGTSEMAVIALGGIVVSTSLPVGGYDLDDAIVRFVQDQHRLLVGHEQAEKVKLEVGSALEGHAAAAEAEVAGRYMSTGMLARITLGEDEVRQALERPLSRIVSALKELLEQTPAQLASDIADRGITLVGGGALLPGFGELIRRETGLPVSRDPEPLTTVARGAGAALAAPPALTPRTPLSTSDHETKSKSANTLPIEARWTISASTISAESSPSSKPGQPSSHNSVITCTARSTSGSRPRRRATANARSQTSATSCTSRSTRSESSSARARPLSGSPDAASM